MTAQTLRCECGCGWQGPAKETTNMGRVFRTRCALEMRALYLAKAKWRAPKGAKKPA